jgi:hypothetical protein
LELYPDYPEVVKNPVWVKLIHSRVGQMSYLSMNDFLGDFYLLVKNCLKYNPEETDDLHLRQIAMDIQDRVELLVKNFRRGNNIKDLEDAMRKLFLFIYLFLLIYFFAVGTYEKRVRKTNQIESDDMCMICKEPGLLICCEKCPKSVHHHCLGLAAVPEDEEYLCEECKEKEQKSQQKFHVFFLFFF